MKRQIFILMLLVVTISLHAQKLVTTFLGIPVDGTKSEMIRKLKSKGFKDDLYIKDALIGEFNGREVNIIVGTNNNKVYRIAVIDLNPTDETNIKIRFNDLCRQFESNKKYFALDGDASKYIIPEDEDIAYNMMVNKKRYEATFCQLLTPEETRVLMLTKYTQEQIDSFDDETKEEKVKEIAESYIEIFLNRIVWFMVSEQYGKYYIALFYENLYNKANGEDL
ncbi:MAG: hypothetical protein J6C05_07885 [Prevotella sp.]|nr:hypothetical protein [Prevotella sp.]